MQMVQYKNSAESINAFEQHFIYTQHTNFITQFASIKLPTE